MFFDGDLQSGIALALRNSKYVACFIRDEDEQSSLWEDDYLKDNQVEAALATKAVTLRINAGSQEAGYLTAYYPIPVVPALIVIHNGQLLLDLRTGEPKDQFKAAILKTMINTSSFTSIPTALNSRTNAIEPTLLSALEQPNQNAQPATLLAPVTTAASDAAQPDVLHPNSSSNQPSQYPSTSRPPVPLSTSSGNQSSQAVQNLLADRRRRLEINKKEEEAAEKADRKAKSDARQAAMTADPSSTKAKQATHAAQQRKQKQEAKVERERILRQIEHDKAERREKEERRKALATVNPEEQENSTLADEQPRNEIKGLRPTSSEECAVQVRLFDGSNIRHKFSSRATLRTDVRAWIDQERLDGDVPYTLKQILTPLSNRMLSISDEEESLQSLGLTPSTTLVMVPIQGYSTAYDHQGIISRGASTGYNMISAGAGIVTGALGTLLGLRQARVRANEPQETSGTGLAEPDSRGAGSSINIRTLQDQREGREDYQLYNGNQLNFEPRRGSDDEGD